jgi:tRNA modification GTPase
LGQMLKSLLANGCRQAEPGEFSQRAFVNGKMDLTQAEAIADLIESSSDLAHQAAVEQMSGALRLKAESLKNKLIKICAQVEGALDFSEEEHQFESRSQLAGRVEEIRSDLEKWLKSAVTGKQIRQGAKVVLTGKVNTGKSSLLNAMLKTERAIVTPKAGTTRDYITEDFQIKGFPVRLVDTAGVRKAQEEIEQAGIERSLEQAVSADLRLLVMDMSQELDSQDRLLLKEIKKPRLLVLNKNDQPAKIDVNLEFEGEVVVTVSALRGQGVADLINVIYETLISQGTGLNLNAGMLTRVRHENAVRRAYEAVFKAENILNKTSDSLEWLSTDLRDALDALGELTGEVSSQDIVNEIFKNFCIGK